MTSKPPPKTSATSLAEFFKGQPSLIPSEGQDELSPMQKISMIYEHMKRLRAEDPSNFDNPLLSSLALLSATVVPTPSGHTSKSTWSFTVPSTACNGMKNLHGGAQATLFDITTSFTIYGLTTPEFWVGHVSRQLNCVYMLPAPLGETVTIENEVVGLGGTLGVVTATMRRGDGRVVSLCTHDKVHIRAKM